VNQVRSAEIQKPENIYVSTVLASLPGRSKILLRTLWEIDYVSGNLVFLEGILDLDLITEPLQAPPDSHLRAAREVAAAVFGKKRFRGEVKIYEPLVGDVVYVASHGSKSWVGLSREDALIWSGMNGDTTPKVEETSLSDILREDQNLDMKKYIQSVQEDSALLRGVTKSLLMRKRAGVSAAKDLDSIEVAGADVAEVARVFYEHVQKIRRIRDELEN
jgi:hypothetical protein